LPVVATGCSFYFQPLQELTPPTLRAEAAALAADETFHGGVAVICQMAPGNSGAARYAARQRTWCPRRFKLVIVRIARDQSTRDGRQVRLVMEVDCK
jgi:hypothetical protein